MDAPTVSREIVTTVGPQFLCTPPNAAVEEGCFRQVLPQMELLGVDLTGDTAGTRHSLPFENYRFARTEGFWAPVDLRNGYISMVAKDSKLLYIAGVDSSELGVSLPSNAAPFLSANFITLDISNDDMVVLDLFKEKTNSGQPETNTYEIYDKQSQTWHNAGFYLGPSIRGFGPWIATEGFSERPAGPHTELKNESDSPGAAFRQRKINPTAREREQLSVDDLYQRVPYRFPGSLHLYNIRSRQNYTIQTNQGDSEILLVDGNTAYYRVNDTLYQASIGQASVGTPVKILSDTNVQMTHWAFFWATSAMSHKR